MDSIQKALNQLSIKEIKLVEDIIACLDTGDVLGLDIQKLKGWDGIFRVRKGSLRIIYQERKSEVFILAIDRRSEKTYRNF